MKAPNLKHVAAEIEKLKSLRPVVPSTTFFGDSNTDAIDAQIEILEQGLDDDDIFDRSVDSEDDDADDKWPLRVRENAMEAYHWVIGDEQFPPSLGWQRLIKSKRAPRKIVR